MDKIRWAILGPGIIGDTFAYCLREVPDAEIVAVGSRSIERSRAFCEKYGGTPYGSYEEMLKDDRIDVVYIATPHNLHEEHVIMCAKAHKNILCEKPFTYNLASAQRMYKACEENGVFIMDGLWSRFFPAWQGVLEKAADPALGRLIGITSSTAWGTKFDPNYRTFRKELAGGALLDAGIYSLAVTTLLLHCERPSSIKADSYFCPSEVDVEDTILLRYPSGAFANIHCGLEGHAHETLVVFENGTIEIPRHRNPDRFRIYMGAARERWSTTGLHEYLYPYYSEGFQFEAMHVGECLRQGLKTSPAVRPEETLLLMEICDEIRRQANFVYPFEH